MTTILIYAGAAMAEIVGCFAVWAWMRRGGERAMAGPWPGQLGRLRLAPDPRAIGFRRAVLRGLWRRLYRGVAYLALGR